MKNVKKTLIQNYNISYNIIIVILLYIYYKYSLKNTFFLSISAYFSPNFFLFFFFYIFYFVGFFKLSKYSFNIILLNLILSIPAIYYVFFLEIYFFLWPVSGDGQTLISFNPANKIIIISSLFFFYYLPFLFITKNNCKINLKTFFLALFVFLIWSIWFLNFESKSPKNKSNKQLVNDVKPGHNGAILTLSNGKKVILDSAVNGETLSDANLGIIKKDGEIIYTGKTDELVYNTVTTDKGRQWRLTLPDGSKVWLNAQSSIHYPLNFTDKERVVEIAGEVFFEVVHNSKKPFKVKVGNKVIADIGTSFNINAYADESDMKTTLIEGSLSISNTRTNIPPTILEPGQQAVVNSTGFIRVNQHQDLDEVMAWKNGMFNFNETNIENIMRQIGRWYDLDIEYSGKITTETFSGMVSRNKSLIQVLKVLEQASIKFKIEGKKIIVIN